MEFNIPKENNTLKLKITKGKLEMTPEGYAYMESLLGLQKEKLLRATEEIEKLKLEALELKDKNKTSQELLSAYAERAKIVDHYRLIMMSPDAWEKALCEGLISPDDVKRYLAQNQEIMKSWSADTLSAFAECNQLMYQTALLILHSKGLKVELKKSAIERTTAAIAATPQPKKIKVSTAPKVPEWTKTQENGKAVYGIMKRYNWTKEQAEAHLAKFNT